MTLTEFLLARIAETERRCGDVHHVNCVNARVPERDCTCGNSARVLAECDAKRRIVEEFLAPAEGVSAEWEGGVEAGLRYVIEHLAAVHADHPDHPDYREEWKP
jgi:hypothetical protein